MASTLFGLGSIAEAGGKAYVERRAYDLARRQAESNIEHMRALERQAARQLSLAERTYETGLWENAGQSVDPKSGALTFHFRNKRTGEMRNQAVPGLPASHPLAKILPLIGLRGEMPPDVANLLGDGDFVQNILERELFGMTPRSKFTESEAVDDKGRRMIGRHNVLKNIFEPATNTATGGIAYGGENFKEIEVYDQNAGGPGIGGMVKRLIRVAVPPPSGVAPKPKAGKSTLPEPPEGVKSKLPAAKGSASVGGGGMLASPPQNVAALAQAVDTGKMKLSEVPTDQRSAIVTYARAHGLQLLPAEIREKVNQFNGAGAAISQLAENVQELIDSRGNPLSPRYIKAAYLVNSQANYITRFVGRSLGEKGVFTDQDKEDFKAALNPGIIVTSISPDIAKTMLNQVVSIMQDVRKRELEGWVQPGQVWTIPFPEAETRKGPRKMQPQSGQPLTADEFMEKFGPKGE